MVFNDSIVAPMIKSVTTEEDEFVPDEWKKLSKVPWKGNLNSFTLIDSIGDDFDDFLKNIATQNRSITGPLLLIGDIKSKLLKPVHPPSAYDLASIGMSFPGLKWWSGPQSKLVVSLGDLGKMSSTVLFDLIFKIDLNPSAVILSSFSVETMAGIMNFMKRHYLLYSLLDNHLTKVPFYWIVQRQIISNVFDGRLGFSPLMNRVSDFLTKQGKDFSKSSKSKEPKNMEPSATIETWEDSKAKGAAFFKEKRCEAALIEYKKSVKLLTQELKPSLKSVEEICSDRTNTAKLFTNMSLMCFNISTSEGDPLKMDLSLQYGEKAIEYDPTWDKGYLRVAEAFIAMNDPTEAEKVRQRLKKIKSKDMVSLQESLKVLAIKDKMMASKRWELVQYKKEAYLVDCNGNGHFKDLSSALAHAGKKPTSLLINPGKYTIETAQILSNVVLDIVGDWKPQLDAVKGWINQDSTITIQNSFKTSQPILFLLACSNITITGVNIFEWMPRHGSHAFSLIKSSLKMIHCSFKSKCTSALAAANDSNICLEGCRSVGGFQAVLADGDGKNDSVSVDMQYCLIQSNSGTGVEIRNSAKGTIKNCMISECAKSGFVTNDAFVTINNSHFDNNATSLSASEGSLQLKRSKVDIQDSVIKNQKGYGMVIEFGSGRFSGLAINKCKTGGILTQAAIDVKECNISHCQFGIVICQDIIGEVVLEKNSITNCIFQILGQHTRSKAPILKGSVIHEYKPLSQIFKTPKQSSHEEDMGRGKQVHEQIIEREQSKKEGRQHYGAVGDVLGVNEPLKHDSTRTSTTVSCLYCTLVQYDNQHLEFFPCPSCQVDYYCSLKCQDRDKEYHRSHCLNYQRSLKLYRSKIKYREQELPISKTSSSTQGARPKESCSSVGTNGISKTQKEDDVKAESKTAEAEETSDEFLMTFQKLKDVNEFEKSEPSRKGQATSLSMKSSRSGKAKNKKKRK